MSKKVLGGRYQLEIKLGEGGMGSVFRALDLIGNKTVAIKVLRKDLAKSQHARRRFAREARAASMLDHPNIVKVLRFCDETRPYIVMEFVDGVSLRRYFRREELSQVGLLEVTMRLCEGLAHAHERGIVHRDIKPDNILVQSDGSLKLLDFGLARVRIPEISQLTRSGSALGTCSYMAPEQASGKPADERSDLYSWGIILYEALCGKLPFSGEDPAAVLYMHVHEEPKAPRLHNPDIHPAVEKLLLSLLSKDPEDRPDNAHILSKECQAVIHLLEGRFDTLEMSQELTEVFLDSEEDLEEEKVSVLAADIPSFTILTRGRNPLEATEIESLLAEELENSVKHYDGTLLERHGTRVVAAFAGEEHGLRAISAVERMRNRATAILSRYQLETKPLVSAGVFGGALPVQGPTSYSSWEELARQELLHGASRLERLSRRLSDDTLVSEDSLPAKIPVESLRSLFVRGRREPVEVYRVVS